MSRWSPWCTRKGAGPAVARASGGPWLHSLLGALPAHAGPLGGQNAAEKETHREGRPAGCRPCRGLDRVLSQVYVEALTSRGRCLEVGSRERS